jgi:ATP-dependent Clp protease ATP-binding subunit ClpC
MDAASILKPALARGELRCIGATTPAEYKKTFESDHALERRFQIVRVEEPGLDRVREILKGITPSYEQFHSVAVGQDALEAAAALSDRYFPHKHQPDKAIDLLDEALAHARLKTPASPTARQKQLLEQKWQEAKQAKKQAVLEERYEDATMLKAEEERMASLLASLPIPARRLCGTITKEHIYEVVSRMTRIPLPDLLGSDMQAKTLALRLGETILGQTESIATIAGALERAKAGLQDPERPLASFLFLGPSGVGKTETAKAIARHYFQDPKAIARFDMSEYAEGFTVSKLVGSPAGYVGYRESAALTDRVKARPHCVLLFDEIEKAHRDVQNILLQILEEGELMDATGRRVSFRQTLIVLTSNIGLERLAQGSLGFQSDAQGASKQLQDDLRQELKDRLRPELLNRLDHICLFRPLHEKTLKGIAEQYLSALAARLEKQQIFFTWDAPILDFLAKTCDPSSGARALRQAVQTYLEHSIAQEAIGTPRPLHLKAKISRGSIHLMIS